MITKDSRIRRGIIFSPALGVNIQYNRNAIKEVLHHDQRNEAHLASVYSIPEFIQSGKLLANVHDTANNREFLYLVSKFNYRNKDYLGLYTKPCVFLEFKGRIMEVRLSAEQHAFQEEVLSIPESIGLSPYGLDQVVDTFDPAA